MFSLSVFPLPFRRYHRLWPFIGLLFSSSLFFPLVPRLLSDFVLERGTPKDPGAELPRLLITASVTHQSSSVCRGRPSFFGL